MMRQVVNTTLCSLVPKMIMDGYEYLFGDKPPQAVRKPKHGLKSRRKKSDTTKITQRMYNYIMNEHRQWVANNHCTSDGVHRPTQAELTEYLNYHLGLNKSRAAYARVYNNKLDYEALAKGPVLRIVV